MSESANTQFITATRKKLRFETARGGLNTEDLWDLSLDSLDKIAVDLDEKVQKAGRKSFIGKRNPSATVDVLKLDVVKTIIEIKIDDDDKKKTRAAAAGQRAFLNDLLIQKQTDALKTLSVEEIQKQIASLGEE